MIAERSTRHEEEPAARVHVEFFGFTHDSLNLKVIPQMVTALERILADRTGKIILFMEAADLTRTQAEKIKTKIKEIGFLGAYIWEFLDSQSGNPPTRERVIRRIQEIAASDLQTVLQKELLSEEDLLDYFLYQELDLLSTKYDFNIEFETHPPAILERLRQLGTKFDSLSHKLDEVWAKGDFDGVLTVAHEMEPVLFEETSIREPDIIEYLKKNAKKLLRKPQGGALFIIFGSTHYRLFTTLKEKLSPGPSFSFDSNPSLHEQILDLSVDELLRNKQPIPDNLWAQWIVAGQFSRSVAENSDINSLATSFEFISFSLTRLAMSLSLEEIRQLCESKQDLLEFLRNHPQAGLINPFLPKPPQRASF